jgi:hypothetical protein
MQQTARINVLTAALIGVILHIKRGEETFQLHAGNDTCLHLQPGDTITIEATSDERWVEANTRKEAAAAESAAKRDDVDHAAPTDLDAQARAEIAARPDAGPDLSGEPGMTLAEGLKVADEAGPADPGAGPGEVTSTSGATSRRSTRGTSTPSS